MVKKSKKQVCVERSRKSFAVFAKATHLHGFHEIYYAKTMLATAVWVIIVIAAIVLTTYMVYRSILQYTTQTSLSLISPLDTGGITYPPLSICFIHWMSWMDWKKAYSMNFTQESLLYGLSFLTPTFSPTVFNVTEAKKLFLENMAVHNISTMSEFYKRVAKPLSLVVGPYDKPVVLEVPPFFNDIEFHLKGSDQYLCYKIDGNEILEILNDKNDTNKLEARSESQIFNFSVQDFRFSRISNYITEEAYNFYVSYWLLTRTNYWIVSLEDFKKNFTGFAFPYRIYPDTYSKKFVEISIEYDSYLIEMQPSVHRWMNTIDYRCKENQVAISSDHRCSDTCKADFRHNMSLCLPVGYGVLVQLDTPENLCQNEIYFLPELNNHTSNTSLGDLFSTVDIFNKDKLSSKDFANDTYVEVDRSYHSCENECIPACEIWKYEFAGSFQILGPTVRALSYTNQTDINIVYPNEGDVLIVIEENSQTWEDFVGNVGGVLGIWIGASILSIFQFFYLCCCYDCSCDRLSHSVQAVRRQSVLIIKYLQPVPPPPITPHDSVANFQQGKTANLSSPPSPYPGVVSNFQQEKPVNLSSPPSPYPGVVSNFQQEKPVNLSSPPSPYPSVVSNFQLKKPVNLSSPPSPYPGIVSNGI